MKTERDSAVRPKKKMMQLAAELLFPRRCLFCDEVLGFSGSCKECDEKLKRITRISGRPIEAEGHNLEFVQKAWAPYFYEGIVRNAVLRMKFGERTDLARLFAEEMAQALNHLPELQQIDCIVPVPSEHQEKKNRGYDVPYLLAGGISGIFGIPAVQALVKIRKSPRQVTLTGMERRKNLKNAFAAVNPVDICGKHVLIVDDVITTGTTVNECAKTLLAAGAESCSALGIAVTR